MFLGVKVIEYADKFEHHIVPGPYFDKSAGSSGRRRTVLLALLHHDRLHALHMIIGIGLMTVIAIMAWRKHFDSTYYTPVEVSGLYWHFVDIVWIFLFPLLYLIAAIITLLITTGIYGRASRSVAETAFRRLCDPDGLST